MSETSTSFTIELGRNEIEKNHTLKRLQDFEKWMWKECFKSPVLCAMKYEKKRCTQLLGVCDYCHDTYFFEDSHCPSCHKTLEASQTGLNFSEHVAYCERKLKMDPDSALCSLSFPPRIRLLKLLLALIEVSVLPEALQPVWTNGHWKSWGMKLQSSSCVDDLLQVYVWPCLWHEFLCSPVYLDYEDMNLGYWNYCLAFEMLLKSFRPTSLAFQY
ncbi:HOMEOBOX-DDT DOMAIN PROTEIN RLT2 [Salix viminalis]|uniref:HOMEOBOX-DDT DOMAIN PROTEIN RLT2 n=1 Tax=Salix viminalis TaxID=40686 RepID=A0A9Q0SI25_SALVM|nr:HOMEOBOX-DDT DOMAIN PROTEIN RLT2 [Salix viminalis]